MCVALLALVVATGCGKRGAPLPPLARVPGKVDEVAVVRSGDEVFVSFRVPSTNIGGQPPADLARVEIYAVTADILPALVDGVVPNDLTLVATIPVAPPPAPGAQADVAAPPTGVPQGQPAVIREQLSANARTPVASRTTLPPVPVPDVAERPPLSLPLVWVPDTGRVRRHYVVHGVSPRGRRGPWSEVRSVALDPTPRAPTAAAVTYDAAALTLSWTPAADARVPSAPPIDGALVSRPFGPPQPLTKFNVYDGASASATPGPVSTVVRPTPLNAAPLDVPRVVVEGVVFARERCFVVRAIDPSDPLVEGAPSAPVCVTPEDTFPPAAPTALEAVGGAGLVSLIWEGVEAADLAGYLVLRGEAPGAPTTVLTPAPIRATSFEDRSVTPGVRYVYLVVAVDSATPANRSAPSNRVEETARN